MSVRIYGIMSLVKMDEEDSMIIFSTVSLSYIYIT